MREARAVRVARGVLASTLATFVALLSHIAAGAEMPGFGGVLTPWVISTLAAVVLVGRRLSMVRLSMTVALSQALFHLLFVLGTGSSTGLVGVVQPGHEGHGMMFLPASGSAGAVLMLDAPMLIAHAVAAVVTIAALHRGEHSMRTLLQLGREFSAWARRQVAGVIASATVAAQPAVPLRIAFSHDQIRLVPEAPFLSTLVRRGPPDFAL